MKQDFPLSRLSAAVVALAFIFGVFISAHAQTPSATPDSFVAQLTASGSDSFAGGISGSGRFVVVESTGDISTERTTTRNNADGNREIFLIDYGQRRIFQITDTLRALVDPTRPATDPATPLNFSNIDVEVSNNRPIISHNGRWIVWSSNAYNDTSGDPNNSTPARFDGNDAANRTALKADGNQEIFLYLIPAVTAVDLSSGVTAPPQDLATGTLIRVTRTPASFLPRAGTANSSPSVADDNRFANINDDASFVCFVSNRNFSSANGGRDAAGRNSEALPNAEIFVYNRTDGLISQLTDTLNPPNSAINIVFNSNPTLSGSGARIAFLSSASNPVQSPADPPNTRRNGEVYVADFNGIAMSNVRRATTPVTFDPNQPIVHEFNFGRRMSRDGNFLLFESTANIQPDGSITGTLNNAFAIFLFNITAASNPFTQIGARSPANEVSDVLRFPTFTTDNSTIVFASSLNFRTDGTAAAVNSAEGINPDRRVQIFSTPIPSSATPLSLRRLTRTASIFQFIQPFPSDTTARMAFSLQLTELGGGNADGSAEAYYVLVPPQTSETPSPSPSPIPQLLSYFTGATEIPVTSATPAPSPSPAPYTVTGLAAGELGVLRSTTVTLAASAQQVAPGDADTQLRSPSLPIELNGVSVSVANAAVGLYSVSPNQINFVLPIGLLSAATPLPVVINNRGAVIRSTLQLNFAQPDIFSSTNGPGGRAMVFNNTDPMMPMRVEPFDVTTTRLNAAGTPETVPTQLTIILTGVRGDITPAQTTVRIRGARDVSYTGAQINAIRQSRTPGFFEIVVTLTEALRGSGDSVVIVSVTNAGQTLSSRPEESAPRIFINP